jgi:hypothetical protein
MGAYVKSRNRNFTSHPDMQFQRMEIFILLMKVIMSISLKGEKNYLKYRQSEEGQAIYFVI